MKTEIISTKHPTALQNALDVLNHNGLVAFPTDTVYGLAAPAYHRDSIDRLYIVKGRNHTKAIAVLFNDIKDLEKIAVDIPDEAYRLAGRFWPGPLTLVLKRHPDLPEILAPEPTIGTRIPDHPDALALMNLSGPLAVTSANLSGRQPACTAQEVFNQLKGRVHLILDGGSAPCGIPSTVVDSTTTDLKILREGPLSLEDLQRVLDK
jgi:L-threonylcarbamoyladenylate synthase